jgi:hypothetical protein
MESVANCGCIQSVAELTVRTILISSTKKYVYLEYLIELKMSWLNKFDKTGPRTDH